MIRIKPKTLAEQRNEKIYNVYIRLTKGKENFFWVFIIKVLRDQCKYTIPEDYYNITFQKFLENYGSINKSKIKIDLTKMEFIFGDDVVGYVYIVFKEESTSEGISFYREQKQQFDRIMNESNKINRIMYIFEDDFKKKSFLRKSKFRKYQQEECNDKNIELQLFTWNEVHCIYSSAIRMTRTNTRKQRKDEGTLEYQLSGKSNIKRITNEKEEESIYKNWKIKKKCPKVSKNDPMTKILGKIEFGQLVKVSRTSETAGGSIILREVSE